ncbi:MAG: response regulator transcription factor [Chloroflexota bacterium]
MVRVLIGNSHCDQQLLTMLLRSAGYSIAEANGSGETLREIVDGNYEIIILPLETPPIEGVNFLSVVRRMTQAPIVVIGPDDEIDTVQTLLEGADVYLKRPIDPDEFLARMTALVRRMHSHKPLATEGEIRQFADLAWFWSQLSDLTPVETRLLDCLLDRQGSVASREDLMLSVWGEQDKSSSLRFFIRQLRLKLGKASLGEILNLKGRGYCLLLRPVDSARTRP